jgi:hypothetical protein
MNRKKGICCAGQLCKNPTHELCPRHVCKACKFTAHVMCSKQEMEGEIMECFLCIDGAKKPAAQSTTKTTASVVSLEILTTPRICCITQCKHQHIDAPKCSVKNCFMHVHPACYHQYVLAKKKPIYDDEDNELIVCATKHYTLLSKSVNPTPAITLDTPQQAKQPSKGGAEGFMNALAKSGYHVWSHDGKHGPGDPNDSITLLLKWITNQENYDAYCIGVKAQICNKIADWLRLEGVRTERTGKDVRNKIDTLKTQYKSAIAYMRGTGAGVQRTDPKGFMARVHKICPYYDDLHKVMHERAGTNPPYVSDDRKSMYAGSLSSFNGGGVDKDACGAPQASDSLQNDDEIVSDEFVDANEEEDSLPTVTQNEQLTLLYNADRRGNYTAPNTNSSQKSTSVASYQGKKTPKSFGKASSL